MKLYHYSKQRYPELKTIERQRYITHQERTLGIAEKEKYQRPGAYFQHVSFLLEPAPLDILGEIFGKEHHTWAPGNKMYEYIVESSNLGAFKYELVETPEKTKLFYRKNLDTEAYILEKDKMIKLRDYTGEDNLRLERAALPLVGLAKNAFKKLPSFNNWLEIKNKYAANVPHVMIYPATGIIGYESIKEVMVY